MATKFRLRRSATADKRPVESDLLLGELALNTYDGRLYTKRDTNNVGIADTAALLTPWTENFGGGSIYYSNSVGIGSDNPQKNLDIYTGQAHATLRLHNLNNGGTGYDSELSILGSASNSEMRINMGVNSDPDREQIKSYQSNLIFTTNTDERLRITSDGKMGLGTNNPATTFVVDKSDSSGLTAHILVNNSESSSGLSLVGAGSGFSNSGWPAITDAAIIRSSAGSANGISYHATNGYHSFWTGSGTPAEKLRITSAGNVGINETSPRHHLTVNSGTTNVAIAVSSTDAGSFISYQDNTTGDTGTNSEVYAGATGGSFVIHTDAQSIPRVTVTNGGDVGIGTDGPDEILHLGQLGTAGNNYNEGRLKIGGFPGTGYGFLVGYDNRGSGRGNIVNANNSGGNANRINIGFGAITASGSPTTEVLTLNQLGRVGIGSAIPDYMLDVSGAINSETDVKVGGVSVSETALNDAVAMAIALG